ncbi:MAG: PLP-dependent aspartate aminotransferase family protein [Polyangiaceae bacterium]
MIDQALPYSELLRKRANAIATACVHSGDSTDAEPPFHALETPIVLSSAFGFASAKQAAAAFRGENHAYIYGRWGNPTVESLERSLAALENAEAACATASGMAAISGALLSTCVSGDHIVAPRSIYAETARLMRERFPRFGITTTFVDATTAGAYQAALTPQTRALYIETPANPTLGITDIAEVVALAKSRNLVTIADNTFATPFSQTPLALDVDLVVHSATKGIGGHGDAIAGAVCGSKTLVDQARDVAIKGFGGVISPLTAFLVARGIRTFALRQRACCENAAELAQRLHDHPRVKNVRHPSLGDHPRRDVACAQMHAFGSLLSFEVASLDEGRRVLEGVKTITHAVSLGDTRSLLVHPASTTHSTMPAETRRLADITDGLLRLSVGIESIEDLWADLDSALSQKK